MSNLPQISTMPPPWWRTSWFGYIASVLIIGALLLVDRIDQYFPSVPIFVGAPFVLISILMALVWGIGPALFAIV
ncbi:MAG TPA: hypothetical protein VHZ51_16110, partial [Ktedonobacteraceae bacterium]|nr:hypothetical protein [Ktedonobacteraceae bacterium]